MASFTDGKPFIVTEKDLAAPWSGFRDARAFRCHLCGCFFNVGDTVRFVYVNGGGSPCRFGNFFVCSSCDGEDVIERAAKHEEFVSRTAWWLLDYEHLPAHPARKGARP